MSVRVYSIEEISLNIPRQHEINVGVMLAHRLQHLHSCVIELFFYPLEVVARYREPQLEVGENTYVYAQFEANHMPF